MNTETDSNILPVRVYYEDTDAQGVVYFANYLRFMERGRTEWLRARGMDQGALIAEQNICFSLIDTAVKFLRPAKFDDRLVVVTRVVAAKGARVQFEQAIRRETPDGELLCSATCTAACLTADSFTPRRVPPELITARAADAPG